MRTVRTSDGRTGFFHAITVRDGVAVAVVEVMVGGERGVDGLIARLVAVPFEDVDFCYRAGEPLPDDNRRLDPLIVAAQQAAARMAVPLRMPPGGIRGSTR